MRRASSFRPRLPRLARLPGLLRLAPILAGAACAAPGPTGAALSGDSLRLGDRVLRLAGIEAPAPGQPCLDAAGTRYDCGEAARAALGRLSDFRDIACLPAPAPADADAAGSGGAGPPAVHCAMAGRDLAEAQLRAGWALPAPGAPPRYRAAAKAAETARRGLWAGGFEAPAAFRARWREGRPRPGLAAPRAGDCAVKGNIAGRARIYHRPGDPNYDQVVIAPEQGERWFCSEAEAIAAGWRGVRG